MSQIKRKRRLNAIEVAVLGNILYLIIVIIFKSVFDMIGRITGFNYIFNGIELAVVGFFWIFLFGFNFKNIYADERPQYFKYIFFVLIPILLLTVALTLVSLFWPGQDTTSIWNQFSFLAAPTIFWYLPYGLIYQFVGDYISIFAFFGIALGITILFQVIGMFIGRLIGRKYQEETQVEIEKENRFNSKEKKEKEKRKGKDKKQKQTSIGMERLSEENVYEGFRPGEQESIMMTEVIIGELPREDASFTSNVSKEEIFSEEIVDREVVKSDSLFTKEVSDENTDFNEINGKNGKIPVINEKREVGAELETRLSEEWQLTHPEEMQEEPKQNKETDDKSFFMETSKIKIINEEDIEEYYRKKK